MLIISRSNCSNTASGIVFCVSDRLVCTQDGHLHLVTWRLQHVSNIMCSLSGRPFVHAVLYGMFIVHDLNIEHTLPPAGLFYINA